MGRKRKKKPQVPLESMTRPLLEKIFARRERGDLDYDECVGEISALMDKVGRESVMNALVRKLGSASDDEWDTLMTIIVELGDEKTVKRLWRLVRRSNMSAVFKNTALVILNEMGEDVDLSTPGEYFSPRDFSIEDLAEVERMGRHSTRMLIRDLHKCETIGEIESMVEMFDNPDVAIDVEGFQLHFIDEVVEVGDAGAADMLLAIASGTARPEVRRAARDGLLKLSGRGMFPQFGLVKRFSKEKFYAAYCTDPAHPWQQQVTMVWEWPEDLTQAMVFLLDFGYPWRGSIKDLFVTRYLSKDQLHRDLIEGPLELRRAPFARARKFILDALRANERHGRPLPPEYDQFERLIERRIIRPSEEALTQAEALDAETEDEWGVLEEAPVRGINFVDGQPVIGLDEEAMRAFEEDPESFDDYLRSIGRAS